ncbi:MAG TPA: hypothetical protein VEA77_05500 [Hyphomicrobium sp.]|nr:hypothetical protein [Hyphomicrobium sp.]
MNKASERYSEQLRAARERLVRTNVNDPALLACVSGLGRVEEVLRRPLQIVIMGEYNSGKTSVTDLLIGDGLLPTSVVSNTQVPVLISYGEAAALYGFDRDGTRIRVDSEDDPLTDLPYKALQLTLPLERIRGYQILDTPSLVNPEAFVADADIIIWCTVATRAWTESERTVWSGLPPRCFRNALLVATHKDAMQSEEECDQVAERLRSLSRGFFRDVVMVGAEDNADASSPASPEDDALSGASALREAVSRLADGIIERRTRKAEKIVRRLARMTFHHFASGELRPEAAALLASWEIQSRILLEHLAHGRRGVQPTIEDLLVLYAFYAERLRPGVVSGDSIPASATRALTTPVRWPAQNAAAAHLVKVLVSDLTGLLRMLAGTSIYIDPAVRAEYQAARAVVLSLADLDGAFDALGKMLGSPLVSAQG